MGLLATIEVLELLPLAKATNGLPAMARRARLTCCSSPNFERIHPGITRNRSSTSSKAPSASPTDPGLHCYRAPHRIYVTRSAGSRQEREGQLRGVEAEGAAAVPDMPRLTNDMAIVPNAFEMRRMPGVHHRGSGCESSRMPWKAPECLDDGCLPIWRCWHTGTISSMLSITYQSTRVSSAGWREHSVLQRKVGDAPPARAFWM